MTISKWMHVGTILKMNAINYPDKLGCQDKNKSFTFKEWNTRTCRLANALTKRGVGYQDRFAIIAYNRVEWLEIYGCCAKGGQVMVPIMFRLAPPEIEYIVNHAECKGFIVEEPFVEIINGMRAKLPTIPTDNYIYLGEGPVPDGYIGYEEFLANAAPEEPERMVDAADMWTIMYTSGTTGRPKGVVKTHESVFGQYYNSDINMGILPTDKVLLVMPMCHINSVYYSYAYTLVTAPVMIYNMMSFEPEDMLRTMAEYKITFTSLVPTHYIMMLALPDEIKNKYDVSSIRQLLISSAPARKDLKVAIMEHFKNAELWEAYGSTEAGLVTLLRPEDQFKKLGSIGKEIFGSDRIKILNETGAEVPDGEVGELYSRTPSIFREYWKDPEKTKSVFSGEWFSAGDMCRRDEDGYYYLVDRKANMIITGGENVYPSEVENCMGAHRAVKDVAVIGVPDKKWGESVKAIVVLHQGHEPSEVLAEEIIEFCKGKIAGFKRPKTIDFIKDVEMPRTGTGKILHRVLREKYGTWSNQ
ncbi:MAG: long-chain fatty acid--CoA ligase [Deltaproteobacteria bacterium RBG_16_54_18]|nr:MAG: long-chain fatty acid--CoA ligase [Deltaproteobacteria bacterium RBG_16_54_18]